MMFITAAYNVYRQCLQCNTILLSQLHSLRHALPHAPDRAVLHFAVEVHARAVQDSEPLVPRLLAARHALHPRVPEQRALMESGVDA